MTRTRMYVRTGLFIAALGALAGVVLAGPLDPPAGPITNTHKTLTEVEPRIAVNAVNTPGDADSLYKITQRGSYYLTGNISSVAGKHGIEVTASGVTLDLNGFNMLGLPGSLDGVSVTAPGLSNIAVVNGAVRDWDGDGVDLLTVGAYACRVADVRASNNSFGGIIVGSGSTVTGCSAYQNASSGIAVGFGGEVANCTVYQNGTGLNVNLGSTVSNCSAFQNAGNGISASNGSTLTGCSASQNSGHGINTGSGCTVVDCSANNNINYGINVGSGSTVADCTANSNTGDGIRCTSGCVIRGNTCNSNGVGNGAGIQAISVDNRIEGNNCTLADRGIDVNGPGNIIIGNTCSGNTTNWEIAANNVCGPIVDRTAPASAAISGNSAPDSTGSTHPHANFTY
jgi:parallel beta-helix repeat protein